MSTNKEFHDQREQECRDMAAAATDPEIRKRHEELAELHATFNRVPAWKKPQAATSDALV